MFRSKKNNAEKDNIMNLSTIYTFIGITRATIQSYLKKSIKKSLSFFLFAESLKTQVFEKLWFDRLFLHVK